MVFEEVICMDFRKWKYIMAYESSMSMFTREWEEYKIFSYGDTSKKKEEYNLVFKKLRGKVDYVG